MKLLILSIATILVAGCGNADTSRDDQTDSISAPTPAPSNEPVMDNTNTGLPDSTGTDTTNWEGATNTPRP